MSYVVKIPMKIIVGAGTSRDLKGILDGYNAKTVYCIYDQGIKATGIAEKVITPIKEAGFNVVEFDRIIADAPDTLVEEAGAIGVEAGADVIIGIGGGSTLDSAKAVNYLVGGNPAPIMQYVGDNMNKLPGKPLILIPTTAGTGSEVSFVACVKDSKTGAKLPLVSDTCTYASVAVLDPELTVGLPANLTASTGFDTLAHGIEAYTTTIENPITDLFAIQGIKDVGKYLVRAVKDGTDMEAREGMLRACVLNGLAFGHTFCHLGHAIGTPFGGKMHINHGLSCGVFLPMVVEYIASAVPEKVREIGEYLGIEIPTDVADNEALGKVVADGIRQIRKDINFPTLKGLGVKEEDLEGIAIDGVNEFLSGNCPRKVTVEDLMPYLKAEYDLD